MSGTKISIQDYKKLYDDNNYKNDNYETALFIKFPMRQKKKVSGKEFSELTGLKSTQITLYKKIVKLGMIDELKTKSLREVEKSQKATEDQPSEEQPQPSEDQPQPSKGQPQPSNEQPQPSNEQPQPKKYKYVPYLDKELIHLMKDEEKFMLENMKKNFVTHGN